MRQGYYWRTVSLPVYNALYTFLRHIFMVARLPVILPSQPYRYPYILMLLLTRLPKIMCWLLDNKERSIVSSLGYPILLARLYPHRLTAGPCSRMTSAAKQLKEK